MDRASSAFSLGVQSATEMASQREQAAGVAAQFAAAILQRDALIEQVKMKGFYDLQQAILEQKGLKERTAMTLEAQLQQEQIQQQGAMQRTWLEQINENARKQADIDSKILMNRLDNEMRNLINLRDNDTRMREAMLRAHTSVTTARISAGAQAYTAMLNNEYDPNEAFIGRMAAEQPSVQTASALDGLRSNPKAARNTAKTQADIAGIQSRMAVDQSQINLNTVKMGSEIQAQNLAQEKNFRENVKFSFEMWQKMGEVNAATDEALFGKGNEANIVAQGGNPETERRVRTAVEQLITQAATGEGGMTMEVATQQAAAIINQHSKIPMEQWKLIIGGMTAKSFYRTQAIGGASIIVEQMPSRDFQQLIEAAPKEPEAQGGGLINFLADSLGQTPRKAGEAVASLATQGFVAANVDLDTTYFLSYKKLFGKEPRADALSGKSFGAKKQMLENLQRQADQQGVDIPAKDVLNLLAEQRQKINDVVHDPNFSLTRSVGTDAAFILGGGVIARYAGTPIKAIFKPVTNRIFGAAIPEGASAAGNTVFKVNMANNAPTPLVDIMTAKIALQTAKVLEPGAFNVVSNISPQLSREVGAAGVQAAGRVAQAPGVLNRIPGAQQAGQKAIDFLIRNPELNATLKRVGGPKMVGELDNLTADDVVNYVRNNPQHFERSQKWAGEMIEDITKNAGARLEGSEVRTSVGRSMEFPRQRVQFPEPAAPTFSPEATARMRQALQAPPPPVIEPRGFLNSGKAADPFTSPSVVNPKTPSTTPGGFVPGINLDPLDIPPGGPGLRFPGLPPAPPPRGFTPVRAPQATSPEFTPMARPPRSSPNQETPLNEFLDEFIPSSAPAPAPPAVPAVRGPVSTVLETPAYNVAEGPPAAMRAAERAAKKAAKKAAAKEAAEKEAAALKADYERAKARDAEELLWAKAAAEKMSKTELQQEVRSSLTGAAIDYGFKLKGISNIKGMSKQELAEMYVKGQTEGWGNAAAEYGFYKEMVK